MAGISSFDIPALMERYGCRLFVATAVGAGLTLAAAAAHPFQRLVAAEGDAMAAERARARFRQDARMTLAEGGDLDTILPALPAGDPALIWVDPRLPGGDLTIALHGPAQRQEARARLARELDAIARHRPAGLDVVLVGELDLYEAGSAGGPLALAEAALGATHGAARFPGEGGLLILLPRGRGGPGPLLAATPAPRGPLPWHQLGQPAGAHFALDRDDGTPALLGLIDGSPKQVLDGACYTGLRGALLKQRFPGARVVGLEPSPAAAERAAGRLDVVACADLATADPAALGIGPGSLDLVILADVIERLVNPWQLLADLRGLMAPGGTLLARIANVRSLSVLESLAKGNWSYQGGEVGGPLDIHNLRFFTRRETQRLFQETGYKIDKFVSSQDARGGALLQQYTGETAQTVNIPGVMTLFELSPVDRVEIATAHFLVSASVI
jgi:hypothetical protein